MKVRREVLGDEHVDRAIARTTPLTEDFQDLITRYAWGEIWARPGLDRRMRSAITLMALVALNREEELAMHVRAALRNGLTARRDQRGDPAERDLLRRPGRQRSVRGRAARARGAGHGGRRSREPSGRAVGGADADRALRRRPRGRAAGRSRGARRRRGGRARGRPCRERSRTCGSAARTRRARTTATSRASPRCSRDCRTRSPA